MESQSGNSNNENEKATKTFLRDSNIEEETEQWEEWESQEADEEEEEENAHDVSSGKRKVPSGSSTQRPKPLVYGRSHGSYMADTAASKNRHRDKVELSSNAPASKEEREFGLDRKPSLTRSNSNKPKPLSLTRRGSHKRSSTIRSRPSSQDSDEYKHPFGSGGSGSSEYGWLGSRGGTPNIVLEEDSERELESTTPTGHAGEMQLQLERLEIERPQSPSSDQTSVEETRSEYSDRAQGSVTSTITPPSPDGSHGTSDQLDIRDDENMPQDVDGGIYALERQLSQEKAKVVSLETEKQDVEKTISVLRQELKEEREKNADMKRRIQDYKTPEEALELENMIKDLKKSDEFHRDLNRRLEDELKQAKQARADQQSEEVLQQRLYGVHHINHGEGETSGTAPASSNPAMSEMPQDITRDRWLIEELRAKNKQLLDGVPKLRKENEKLKNKLASYEANLAAIKEELTKTVFQSDGWKNDYLATSEHLHQRNLEFDKIITQNAEEVQRYIKEYHDRIPERNKEWWNVEGLQQKVAKLKEQVQNMSRQLQAVKDEKQVAHERNKILIEEREEIFRDMNWGSNSQMRRSNFQHVNVESSSKQPPRRLIHAKWDTPEARQEREQILHALREKQQKRREEEDEEVQVMDKLRNWNYDKMTEKRLRRSSKKSRIKEAEKNAWVRWRGDAWLRSGISHEEEIKHDRVIQRLRRGQSSL